MCRFLLARFPSMCSATTLPLLHQTRIPYKSQGSYPKIEPLKPLKVMVPGGGVEPPWAEARGILSPVRLPVSPPRREAKAGARRVSSTTSRGVCRDQCLDRNGHRSVGPERVKGNGWRSAEDQLLDEPPGQRSKEDSVAMMACGEDQAFDAWMSPEQRQLVGGVGTQSRPGSKQGGRADGGNKLRDAGEDRSPPPGGKGGGRADGGNKRRDAGEDRPRPRQRRSFVVPDELRRCPQDRLST